MPGFTVKTDPTLAVPVTVGVGDVVKAASTADALIGTEIAKKPATIAASNIRRD